MAWIQKQTVNSCAGNWLLNCVEMCLAIRSLPVYCLWIDGRAFQDAYMIRIDIIYDVWNFI